MASSALDPSVHRVVAALAQHGDDVTVATRAELDRLATQAVDLMRRGAPKWRSTLTESIKVRSPSADVREIGPRVAYAEAVERGVKPGGKGLPRFMDPASVEIVAWLRSKAFAGVRVARVGTKRRQGYELALRDRYEGLAWHVRHKGVRAQPFVAPVAREMEAVFAQRMAQAVRRALAARSSGGGSALA